MDYENSKFGARLREMRKKRDFTVKDFSEALDISESYLSLLERDERSPSLTLLTKICVKLGVSIDYLLYGRTPENAFNISKISLDVNEVKDFYPAEDWLGVDKELTFGLAVGKAVKLYGLSDKALSFLYAAIKCIVWKMETTGFEGGERSD